MSVATTHLVNFVGCGSLCHGRQPGLSAVKQRSYYLEQTKEKVGKKQGCEQEVTCSRGPEKVETGPPSKCSVKVVADPSNVLSGPRTRSRTEII